MSGHQVITPGKGINMYGCPASTWPSPALAQFGSQAIGNIAAEAGTGSKGIGDKHPSLGDGQGEGKSAFYSCDEGD